MAAAVAMDLDQCDSKAKTAALSINKTSSRISKAIRRPIVQQAKPMPTSKVYNTDPMGFRNLVQELTGYAPNDAAAAPVPAVPAAQAADPAPFTAAAALAPSPQPAPMATARPVNARLQKMAPPPLKPTFSFSFTNKFTQQQQQQQQLVLGSGGNSATVSPTAHPISPMSKRVSPMPLLSFSPLPALSPRDNVWANFESPNTAAMKQLAQSIIDSGGASAPPGGKMGFPWSPTFQACFGLPSPGLPVPELFPEMRMMDSADKDFSFPNLKDSSSAS